MKRSHSSAFTKQHPGGSSSGNNNKRAKTKEPSVLDGDDGLEPLGKISIIDRDWSKIEWSPEQIEVIAAVRAGRNVFMTGPGGVGKSTLIPYLIHILQEEENKIVRITATTGIAAVQIGGTTLHSFVGVGLGEGAEASLIRKAQENKDTVQRWTKVDTLIIDEISMADPEYFIKADRIGRALRGHDSRAFGGMQIIISGDFFQLPPVIVDKEKRTTPYEFAFDTPSWWDLKLVNVELKTVFRQSDRVFVDALNRIRFGEPTPTDLKLLAQRVQAPIPMASELGIEPTVLYSRCRNVEEMNMKRLQQLDGPDYMYHHKTGWVVDEDGDGAGDAEPRRGRGGAITRDLERYLRHLQADMMRNTPAEKTVVLRKNAQVMLLINLDQEKGLVNGSRGVIVGFDTATGHPMVRFKNGIETVISPFSWKRGMRGYGEVYYKQVPLKLAWSVTIHKSQGMTLDCSIMSIDETLFERGQAYVALSRIRTLEGLRLTRFDPSVIRAHPRVVEFYRSGFAQPKDMVQWNTLKSFFSVHTMQNQAGAPQPSLRMIPPGGHVKKMIAPPVSSGGLFATPTNGFLQTLSTASPSVSIHPASVSNFFARKPQQQQQEHPQENNQQPKVDTVVNASSLPSEVNTPISDSVNSIITEDTTPLSMLASHLSVDSFQSSNV